MAYELAVVIPTLNEAGNVGELAARLARTLRGIDYEVVFVDDDSTDGTIEQLRELAAAHANVHCLQRIGRRGLASAAIEGMLACSAPYIAVMDADLQHDETLLVSMLETLKADDTEIVVASRFVDGAEIRGLSSRRERLSRLGNLVSRLVIRTSLSDPLAGFFMLRRSLLTEVCHSLTGQGYKILLDIIASARRPLAVVEVPMRFRERSAGASKLDIIVMLEFAMLVADKLFGRLLPVRFVLFVAVGMVGSLLHLSVLWLAFKQVGLSFYLAQSLATLIAMSSNFILNNEFTHRDRRLTGVDLLRGLVSFYFACGIGALANLQLAELLYQQGVAWVIAGLVGAVVGAVWNYGVTSAFTWRRIAA